MTAYTAEVIKLIDERAKELNELIEKHRGTKHEYPLMAGLFEVLSLGEKVQYLAYNEKRDIEQRIQKLNTQ